MPSLSGFLLKYMFSDCLFSLSTMGCSVWLFVTVFLPLLSNGDVGDIHHILCPRGCNCYTEKNTDAQFSFLHFVCRWEHVS